MQLQHNAAMIFLCFGLAVMLSGLSVAQAEDGFSGHYRGRLGEAPATLELHVSSTHVSGKILREGGPDIELKGTVSESRLVGAASSRGSTAFFEGYREFGAMVLVFRETGAVTAQESEIRAEFFPMQEAAQPSTAPATEHDRRLLGRWATQRLERQGDMVLPVRTEIVLQDDGRYSERSDAPAKASDGEWRSDSGYLEIKPAGAESWLRIGEYKVKGHHLITVLPQEEPLVWTRLSD